jgi:prepilin-type N-terminal cleavage/methylation domain-containing protein
MKRMSGHQRGFTIIEILVVIAIGGIILLIVFGAVPAMNRNQRNYERKHAVEYVASQLDSYYNANGLRYPLSGTTAAADKRAAFVSTLHTGSAAKYAIRYSDETSSHQYPYDTASPSDALDEISIAPGHRCNTSAGIGPGDADYPLTTAHGGDLDFHAYVVWTQLEGGGGRAYCVDNGLN